MITDIETGGGVDEILSLFGANRYKVVNNFPVNGSYSYIYSGALDGIKSTDNIKLLISVNNNYLAGVSPTIPTIDGGYADAFVSLNLNGLTKVFVATNSTNISEDGIGFSYLSTSNMFNLNSTINGYEVDYSNPMTSLVIYNSTETS